MIEIYTDGSCKGNPGPGGWAVILLKKNADKPFKFIKGHEKHTTNNRMEMTAIIEALRFLHENNYQQHDISIFSDSNLIVQTLNSGWKRKANIDLWEELDHLNEELQVNYIWVKGHHVNKWNRECDKLAVNEAIKASKLKTA